MNIRGRSFFGTVMLLVCACAATATDRRVVPLEVELRRLGAEPVSKSSGVGLAGVLGYAANCELAVYGGPGDAIARNDRSALHLGAVSDVRFPLDSRGLSDYLGKYVYVEGSAIEYAHDGASRILDSPSVFHVFGSVKWQMGGHCAEEDRVLREWVQLTDLLSDPTRYVGKVVSVAGVLGLYGEDRFALYMNESSAVAGVSSNAIVVSCARTSRFRDVCSSSSSAKGVYVTVVGTVGLGKARGSAAVIIEDVRVVEVARATGAE